MVSSGANATGNTGLQQQSIGTDIKLTVVAAAHSIAVNDAARGGRNAYAANAATATCRDRLQRNVASCGLQQDIAVAAAGCNRRDATRIGLRHGDGASGHHADGFGIALAGDVCVLQNIACRIDAQVSVAQNDVGINRYIGACSGCLQQHIAINDIDTQGTGTDIAVTFADQNRACCSLQDQVTAHDEVRLRQIRCVGQCAAVAANTFDGQTGSFTHFNGGCLTKVDTAAAHIGANFEDFSLYGVYSSANAGCRVKTQFSGENIYARIGELTGIKNGAAGLQTDRTPSRLLSCKLSHHQAISRASGIKNTQSNASAQSRQTYVAAIAGRSRAVDHGNDRSRENIDRLAKAASRDICVLQHAAARVQTDMASA